MQDKKNTSRREMTSLSQWLRSNGLERYSKVFQEQGIDFDVIASLTEQDLGELGLNLGDRKRLLAAIAALDEEAPVPSVPMSASSSVDGERRQLTVMFCDLVGSTELSQKLDPEALRELMRTYQQACGAVIEKYDGHVAQYLGDGLMTYFGWPRAHENGAERAIRSGLEILDEIKQVPVPETLRVRIGIATGPDVDRMRSHF